MSVRFSSSRSVLDALSHLKKWQKLQVLISIQSLSMRGDRLRDSEFSILSLCSSLVDSKPIRERASRDVVVFETLQHWAS